MLFCVLQLEGNWVVLSSFNSDNDYNIERLRFELSTSDERTNLIMHSASKRSVDVYVLRKPHSDFVRCCLFITKTKSNIDFVRCSRSVVLCCDV
jgi:hypothetical protein